MQTRPPRRREPRPSWAYRGRATANLMRMGHCAPTAMQTILDVSSIKEAWPVRLSAGMPGGIGNTGHECGAVTSPLVMLGLRHGTRDVDRGLPVIFDKGQGLCRTFEARHGTLMCKEIRRDDKFPRHCVGPVLRSPELYRDARDGDHGDAIPAPTREGYARLYAHLVESDFHCARAVLAQLDHTPTADRELFDAAAAFVGGTLFLGRTCSALTAGVMAIGLRTGEIESSRRRVIRLLATMTVGGDAFDDGLNKFNPTMNAGNRLARWFAGEYGSTQCRKVTGCDFADAKGVSAYIDGGGVARCRAIGCRVAEQVRLMLDEAGSPAPAAPAAAAAP